MSNRTKRAEMGGGGGVGLSSEFQCRRDSVAVGPLGNTDC
jgi:hypothetical protein